MVRFLWYMMRTTSAGAFLQEGIDWRGFAGSSDLQDYGGYTGSKGGSSGELP